MDGKIHTHHIMPDGTWRECEALKDGNACEVPEALHYKSPKAAMSYVQAVNRTIHEGGCSHGYVVDDERLEREDVSGINIGHVTVCGVDVDDDYVLSTDDRPSALVASRVESVGADDLMADSLTFTGGSIKDVSLDYAFLMSVKISGCTVDALNVYHSQMDGAEIIDNETVSDGAFETCSLKDATIQRNRFIDFSFMASDFAGVKVIDNRFEDCVFSDARRLELADVRGNLFKRCDMYPTGLTPRDFPESNGFEGTGFCEEDVQASYSRDGHGKTADLALRIVMASDPADSELMFTVRWNAGDSMDGWTSMSDLAASLESVSGVEDVALVDALKTAGIMDNPDVLARFVNFEKGVWYGTDIPASLDTIMADSMEW